MPMSLQGKSPHCSSHDVTCFPGIDNMHLVSLVLARLSNEVGGYRINMPSFQPTTRSRASITIQYR